MPSTIEATKGFLRPKAATAKSAVFSCLSEDPKSESFNTASTLAFVAADTLAELLITLLTVATDTPASLAICLRLFVGQLLETCYTLLLSQFDP